MNLKKIRELDIAKSKFQFANQINERVDYEKWVTYVDNSSLFIWYEDTIEGKELLSKINEIPDDFKNSCLALLNKVRCFLIEHSDKNKYAVSIGYSLESKKISISFVKYPKIDELKIFIEMAKHLDAILVKDGKEVIDEKIIEQLK